MTYLKINLVRKIYLFLLLLGSFFLMVPNSFAQRIGTPGEKWLTLVTPHFEIFYSAKHQDLGLYYAKIAELSYSEITTVFTVKPVEKIVVIINDSTDASNGFTTLIPYPYIMLFPVQIGKGEVLSEAGEWGKELFIHELAHVFQLYPAEGVFKYFKPFLGNIVAPNLLMPLWWKEGMAVEVETRFSNQGRIRSTYQDASLRALVDEDKLMTNTLPKINEILPSWPYGSRPYLFGSIFMSELNKPNSGTVTGSTYPSVINDLTLKQARRFPFFIEGPHDDIFNQSFSEHYTDTLKLHADIAKQQLHDIEKANVTLTTPVDSELIASDNPRFNYDHKIIGLVGTTKYGKKLFFYKPSTSNDKSKWSKLDLKKSINGEISSFEFSPFENKIVYAKIDFVDSKNLYSDLYVFDFQTEKEKQITKSARARNPVWSTDSKAIYFISTFDGKTQLKAYKLEADAIEQLFETSYAERIHEVAVLNSNELLVVFTQTDGSHKISLFDVQTQKLSDWFFTKPAIENIRLKKDDLYFTSTENGVANIYKLNLTTKKLSAQSNFRTGALDFDVNTDDNSALAALFTSHGLEIKDIKLVDYKSLPLVKNPVRERYKYTAPTEFPKFNSSIEDASSLSYIYPHYVIPFVTTSSKSRGVFAQLITGGQDPLLIHNYSLSLNYDSYLKKVGYTFDYINSAFQVPLNISLGRQFASLGNTQDLYIEHEKNAIGILPDMFSLLPRLLLNVGFSESKNDDTVIKTKHFGPYAQLLFKGFRQSVFDIYPRNGFSFFLRYEKNKSQNTNLSDFYGDYEQIQASLAGYTGFLLPENHSIFAKVNSLHTFQFVSSRLFGSSNTAFPSGPASVFPEFTTRGYILGQFYGSRMLSLTTEYRFPALTLNQGAGTAPFFLKRINGAVVADGLTLRGGSYDKDNNLRTENMDHVYASAGLEARLESTLGYLLPVNFIVGGYYPFSPQFAKSPQLAISLQIGADFRGGDNFAPTNTPNKH